MGYGKFGQFPPEVHANYVNLPPSCMRYGELGQFPPEGHAKSRMLIIFLFLILFWFKFANVNYKV